MNVIVHILVLVITTSTLFHSSIFKLVAMIYYFMLLINATKCDNISDNICEKYFKTCSKEFTVNHNLTSAHKTFTFIINMNEFMCVQSCLDANVIRALSNYA